MKKSFLWIATLATLAACNGNANSDEPIQEPTQIPINVSMDVWTRATDVAYEAGDEVGIYVVNYNGTQAGSLANSGNHVDNMRFTYTSAWTPDQEIYWKDQTTPADFYCYYPYGTPTHVASYPFVTRTNQAELSDYKASDFLWGKATKVSPTASAVPIITTHSMSNMLIYLAPGEGFTQETLDAATKSVRICHVKTEATIHLATGVATATGSATEVTPYNAGEYYRALIVPQTVADGSNLITVTVDGVDYTLAKGFTFRANTQHKFTVTINKATSGVNIGVGNWEIDETDNGGNAE